MRAKSLSINACLFYFIVLLFFLFRRCPQDMRVKSMSIMGAPVNMDSEHAAVRTSHQSDGVKVYDDYLFLYFVFGALH
jgi:hypothetical protein